LGLNPVSNSGLTAAVINKLSRDKQQYPWQILGVDQPSDIRTSFTVSIDDIEAMCREIKESEYPIIKVKMGFEDDEKLADRLSDFPDKLFRIDANCGWDLEKAERMICLLSRANIEIIEQPTAVEFIKDWKYIKGKAKTPVIVDEGMLSIEDYYRYADFVDGVNIKMPKCGGVLNGRKICLAARKDRLKIMLGCMVESSIGIIQSVYISSLADYLDLDGPLLLKNDISSDIKYDREKIIITEDIIGGPCLNEKYLNA